MYLEAHELLRILAERPVHPQHVKPHCLGQRSALTHSDLVAIPQDEGRADVARGITMALLVSVVLCDVVQVILADNARPLHLLHHVLLESI